ncbi:phosphatase PAP2 family protein [Lewinella sp. W8]|uniref:phosphatase PAP2 family protein n=1 Tax=Lewinella sp. W8 TaxID=2528208 RepID=UPI002682CB29
MKITSGILLYCLVLLGVTQLHAQEPPALQEAFAASWSTLDTEPQRSYTGRLWQNTKTDFTYGLRSVGHTYGRPLKWRGKQWLTAGGIALGTVGLFLIEEDVNPYFARQETKVPRLLDRFAFYFGKPQYNYGLTAGIYTVGLLTENPRMRRTGMVLIASATAAGLIQTVSKTVLGRARPSTGVGNSDFDFFNGTPDYHSFPSGHTVLAVVTAHALAKQTRNPWLKGGIYAVGAITPLSRLWTEAHWLSDVGLSVAISVVVVNTVDRFFTERTGSEYQRPERLRAFNWRPIITPGRLGVGASF